MESPGRGSICYIALNHGRRGLKIDSSPFHLVFDDGPGAPEGNFFWAGDGDQAGKSFRAYKSVWLPASLLKSDQQARDVEALGSEEWNDDGFTKLARR